MRLNFSGAPEVSAPREVVWQKLLDPDFVAASAPGVEKVERLDDTHYKVISAFGVGAIKVRFTLDVELSDLRAPEHASMRAKGKAPGSAVDVKAAIDLTETAPGITRMAWISESEVSGTVASVGGRLLEGTAKKLTEAFWTDFAKRVSAANA
jgi:carbon monoxide dehydrogenase subunit G